MFKIFWEHLPFRPHPFSGTVINKVLHRVFIYVYLESYFSNTDPQLIKYMHEHNILSSMSFLQLGSLRQLCLSTRATSPLQSRTGIASWRIQNQSGQSNIRSQTSNWKNSSAHRHTPKVRHVGLGESATASLPCKTLCYLAQEHSTVCGVLLLPTFKGGSWGKHWMRDTCWGQSAAWHTQNPFSFEPLVALCSESR